MNDITTRLIAALDAAQENVQELRVDRDDRFGQTTESNRSRIADLDANIAELRALRDELRSLPVPLTASLTLPACFPIPGSLKVQSDQMRLDVKFFDPVKLINESLAALPAGNVKTHTPETIPGRIRDLVAEVARLSLETEAWEKWAVELYGRGIEDSESAEMRAAIMRDIADLRGHVDVIAVNPAAASKVELNPDLGDEPIPAVKIKAMFANPAVLRLHIRRHGPAGYDLVDTSVPDPLSHLFQLQAALNARCGVDLTNLSDEDKAKWTLQYTRAMQQEIAELIDSVPWKWWAKYQKFDEQNAKVEVVDLFHFLISLAQVFGMSATDVYEAYLKKNKVNHARQDSGYVAKDANDSKHI